VDVEFRFFNRVNLNRFVFLEEKDGGITDTHKNASSRNNTYPCHPKTGPYKYVLLSVLVHSGSTGGGHYYAFVGPDWQTGLYNGGNRRDWVKLDDSSTNYVRTDDAIQRQFGGWRSASAYMLVYIRLDQAEKLLTDFPLQEIPGSFTKVFAAERRRKLEEKRKREDEAKKTDVRFMCGHLLHENMPVSEDEEIG